MNSIGSSPFGFNYQAMADRQQKIAQSQLDYQKASDTATKASETQAGGGALSGLMKGIKGAKDLKNKIQGGANQLSTLADNLESRFSQAGQMGAQLKGQLSGSTKPPPSQGEDFDLRDANSATQKLGVKPLSATDQGGLGESSGTISNMTGADFSQARGQIQTTLQGKYANLNDAQKGEFDTHMANNRIPGEPVSSQGNLDIASQKLSQLNPMSGGDSRTLSGSSRATLGRAQGDPDGITQPGTSNLAGGGDINPFSQPKGISQDIIGGSSGEESGASKILSGATNLHQTVQDGVDQAGRMAQNTASKLGEVSDTLSSGLTKGIGAMEGVVDSLGPIGDIVGLGMAIFGGIKAHQEHKEEEASAKTQQAQISGLPTTQTVNTSSVGVGGSSSNPLQSQQQSHY